jgi:hypothetical protein
VPAFRRLTIKTLMPMSDSKSGTDNAAGISRP